MKIAYAMINCNRRDGSARAVNEVAERLARTHEVHLYARKAEDLDLSRIAWHRVPGVNWAEVIDFGSYYLEVNRRVRPGQFEIVHTIGCNTQRGNVVTIQNIQPAKKQILDRLGRDEKVSPARRLTRWLYLSATCAAEKRLYQHKPGRRAPMFLPVSRGVAAELQKHYNIGPAQVRIVPNAADTERFKPLSTEARQAWRAQNNVPQDQLMAIFAGGEWARKGLDFAIQAMGHLKDVPLTLFVAGDDPDRARFINMARDAGAADRVIFGGFRKDMPQALGAADFFLFPSWYEAFSLATIEAAACALPVVATRINGTEDFISPGENGDFIEHDAEQIATVLRRLCAQPDHLKVMGANARERVEMSYTWDRIAQMTEDAYKAYLSSSN
ncbi:glycosyltransferase family 4 protein [Prosthecobacter sp.]|uniref:glycosyltransferase family 4 protein n=1 Tax=Prosthecobacter sp. TaxID=1965333 RepID=UPI002AB9F003|nr:glycosyltransferase family 4 protein [Prosthecobacter sp.]MDZ4404508.1 glycosyltransferase family 4 protein [Prosthecobacter sp.]